jgi:hypothetical protein
LINSSNLLPACGLSPFCQIGQNCAEFSKVSQLHFSFIRAAVSRLGGIRQF